MRKGGFCGDVCILKLRVQLIISPVHLGEKRMINKKTEVVRKQLISVYFGIFLRLCFFLRHCFFFLRLLFSKMKDVIFFILDPQCYKEKQMMIYIYKICSICEYSIIGSCGLVLLTPNSRNAIHSKLSYIMQPELVVDWLILKSQSIIKVNNYTFKYFLLT